MTTQPEVGEIWRATLPNGEEVIAAASMVYSHNPDFHGGCRVNLPRAEVGRPTEILTMVMGDEARAMRALANWIETYNAVRDDPEEFDENY